MVHELNLIEIHSRRKRVLEKQKAMTGAHYNATIQIEIEDINRQVGELEQELRRILQQLKLKQATYGLATEPSVLLQIEDIEAYFEAKNGPA